MALPFAGKHCVVVGATGVIGSSIAKAFAQQGAVISLLGRSAVDIRSRLEPQLRPYGLPETDSATAAAQKDIPSAHRFIRLDASNREEIKTLFSPRASSKPQDGTAVGPIDVLVNCAGISQTTLLKRTPDEEISSIVDTNLLATILVCKHAKMRPNGMPSTPCKVPMCSSTQLITPTRFPGCIINVSSLMATKGGLGASAYAASKAGVIGFTRALCREMASRSIRVNALLPGWVNSSMWTDLKPEVQQAYLKDTPLNRVADPEEVANAALFLASNGFANNCILNLDGGLSAA
ncbi:3-ketoacyl-acyl-carrier- reductase [Trichoderma arundinaceum]|uniref:3-ketoacyl-acyl-carrier-reductase n=1 Tax=Trichoderma arundinaceum TaxID=490622 RepID=A0A395P0Q4_TRIAR|nr:3-ketoacyl-acyl-carrier- reductase [Trichoderma arundinaceum]